MNAIENVRESLISIRSNLLRAILTMLVISLGIGALVGMITSFEGIKFWMTRQFSALGSNTFTIQNRASTVRKRGGKRVRYPRIQYHEAIGFKDSFEGNGTVSVTATGSFGSKARYKSIETNPNLQVLGIDENYSVTTNYTIAEGREISSLDIDMGRKVAVLGFEVKELLFPNSSPVGESIMVGDNNYTVIGYFNGLGTSGRFGGDKAINIPISTLIADYPDPNRSFNVSIFVEDPNMIDGMIEETYGAFRLVRKLKPAEENNFVVSKSDTFVNSLLENLQILTVAAQIIAAITLFAAAIGLMNIMLVSVTERTREIGVRKATGARKSNIMFQFLTEALVICELGGLAGIGLGILFGNAVALLLGNELLIPWDWIGIGILLCTIVGLISGIYPAWKASQVDPIESLRYE